MKNNFLKPVLCCLTAFLLFLSAPACFAQLVIHKSTKVDSLVKNVLIGPGIAVSNIKFTGAIWTIAAFNGVNTNIGLDSGILLCTGHVDTAKGPYKSKYDGLSNDRPGFTQLDAIAGHKTYDAAILQFDFVPLSDSVTFRYVFASEEYSEFVCREYNDVFAFFMAEKQSPPLTDTNLALIPGTTIPVSINTINNGNPDTLIPGCVPVNANYFIDNTGSDTTIEYNGFTTVLEARAKVKACSTYTIKLAIADAVDQLYDSGIFIEAGSFSSKKKDNVKLTILSSPDTLAEGCDSAILRFSRNTNLSSPLVVDYTIGGTATNGADYELIPASITIPAGQAFYDLTIRSIEDLLVEGVDTVLIRISNSQFCILDSVKLYIKDIDTLKVKIKYVECVKDTVYYIADVTGGSGNFSYEWTDSLGNILGVNATMYFARDTPFTVYVFVRDVCTDSMALDSLVIPPIDSMTATVTGDTAICNGNSIQLLATGGSAYQWEPPTGLNDPFIPNPIASPTVTTYYAVIIDSPGRCREIKNVLVEVRQVKTNYPEAKVCKGETVSPKIKAFDGGHTYVWSPSTGVSDTTSNSPNFMPQVTTTYTVTATDTILDCTTSAQVLIIVDDSIPQADAGPDRYVCHVDRDDGIELQGGPDIPGMVYSWKGDPTTFKSSTLKPNPTVKISKTTTYYLTTWFSNGKCKGRDTVTVYLIEEAHADFEADVDSCKRKVTFNNLTEKTESVLWHFGDGDSTFAFQPVEHQYDSAKKYTVKLIANPYTDCEDTSTIEITFNDIKPDERKVPNVFSPNGDGKNDVFRITGGNSICVTKKFTIFSRWGEKLYEATEQKDLVWDGTYEGKLLPEGVYFYVLEGEGFTENGTVTLMR